MEHGRRAAGTCLVLALTLGAAQVPIAYANPLSMSEARRATRTQAVSASESALGAVLDEGRGNARITVRRCTRSTRRRILCPWRTAGGLEQSDGHLVRYRCHGRARVRLPGARGRAPVADTSFDCTVRL